ncbi:MAG: metallophosphoesterase family protein [Myxococcales bacterium]|nr:metallophosphoesterase family protein [Myxococcales bacterium]
MLRWLTIAALLAGGASAADARPFEKGPYLQNVSKTSITILWESSVSTPATLTLHTEPKRVFESTAEEIHEVVLDGLKPEQRYRYTVESDGVTRVGQFATAPVAGAPFSFVVYGDSRSNANAHARVIERIRQEVPDFLLGTGDIVNEGSSRADWDELFEIEGPLLREAAMFPSLGNHDRQGRGRTASNFRKFFSLPENSPDPERYYAFSYGSARFVILDSNTYSFALTDQTAWIEEQLQSARLDEDTEHIFVSMHHPPFSISLHGGQSELREAWTPLFEKYQVDAVFSGHDHVYSRAKKNGVNYFVSGGGGAPLYGRKAKSRDIDLEATKFFERTNHHLRVHVVGKHIEVVAVRADGTMIETLSWGELPKIALSSLRPKVESRLPQVGSGAPSGEMRAPSQAASAAAKQRGERGLGLLGILGACMTLGAGVVALWAWRQ